MRNYKTTALRHLFKVISSAVSYPIHTAPGQASSGSLPVLSSPVTDNCPSQISGKERMTVEFFSLPNLHERMFASNPRPSAYQTGAYPIELPRPANM